MNANSTSWQHNDIFYIYLYPESRKIAKSTIGCLHKSQISTGDTWLLKCAQEDTGKPNCGSGTDNITNDKCDKTTMKRVLEDTQQHQPKKQKIENKPHT